MENHFFLNRLIIFSITKAAIVKRLQLLYAFSFIFNLTKTGKLFNKFVKIVQEFTLSVSVLLVCLK